MWNGKLKAVTFSYDDGVTQDKRLIELFGKYSLKATFNLNSALLGTAGSLVREDVTVSHVKPRASEIEKIYRGHEVAAHTLTHPSLPALSDEEVIRQTEEDRAALSALVGYEVVGMAYPGGGVNYDGRVAELIKNNTGIKYARTTVSSYGFDVQSDLYTFKPTVYHHREWDKMTELAKEFIDLKPTEPKVFYIWGHSYEFDIHGGWEKFEEFCRLISEKDDIYYCTNKEALLIEENL